MGFPIAQQIAVAELRPFAGPLVCALAELHPSWCGCAEELDPPTEDDIAAMEAIIADGRREAAWRFRCDADEEIIMLARSNAIVGVVLGIAQDRGWTWAQATKAMVLEMARAMAEQAAMLVDNERRRPMQINVTCTGKCIKESFK